MQHRSVATRGTAPLKAGYFGLTKCYFEATPVVRRPARYTSARIAVSSLEYVSTRGTAKGPHRRHAL